MVLNVIHMISVSLSSHSESFLKRNFKIPSDTITQFHMRIFQSSVCSAQKTAPIFILSAFIYL